MNKNKKIIIALAAAVVIIAGIFIGVHLANQPETVAGDKNIEVVVMFEDETTKEHTIRTDAEFLREALEEEKMISGTESEYGLFVTEVDGVKADDQKQQWWCFLKDGEMLNTGVDSTPIADGDHYEIVLTTGY